MVFKPGPIRQVNLNLADPRLKPDQVYKKIKKIKNSTDLKVWPDDPAKLSYNSLIIYFLKLK
jgi:hypothetical protein